MPIIRKRQTTKGLMKTLVKATILGEVVMAAEGANFVAD
jgi:hypothetical protein